MHVPERPMSELEIITFENALAAEQSGGGDYDRDKWIYLPDRYCEYRYVLGTRGKNPLICIGINPSTAAPDDLDNTNKSVCRIAESNGHDSFITFNVSAQRATDPDDMDKELDLRLHEENMKAFEYVLSNCGKGVHPAIWAAWGTLIEKRAYLADCVRDMIQIGNRYGSEWWSVGAISKKGHPHHPLYLPKNAKKEPFDVEKYLDTVIASR